MRKIQKPTACRAILVSLPHPRDPKARIERPAIVVQAFGTDLVNAKVLLDDANDADVSAAFTFVTSIPFDADGVRFDDNGNHVLTWRYPPRCDDMIEVAGEDPEPVDLDAKAEAEKVTADLVKRLRAEVAALRDEVANLIAVNDVG